MFEKLSILLFYSQKLKNINEIITYSVRVLFALGQIKTI